MNSSTNTDPFYPNVPAKCFVVIPGKASVGLVQRGFQGYSPVFDYSAQIPTLGFDACKRAAQEVVDRYNQSLGVTKAQEQACLIGSMRGWHVPGANPAEWETRTRVAV